MLQVLDEARDRLNALGREAAKRADDGASYLGGLTKEASRAGGRRRQLSQRSDP